MFEAGDSIRGLGIDIEFPLVMMIGYRGWTRHGITNDSAARFTEPMPSSFYRVPRGVQDLIVNCTARHSFQVLRCETL